MKKILYNKKLAIFIILIILFSPISFSNLQMCKCGGCCVGCPGDCNRIGFPFVYYYWGFNGISGEFIKQFSAFGFLIDFAILFFLTTSQFLGKKS